MSSRRSSTSLVRMFFGAFVALLLVIATINCGSTSSNSPSNGGSPAPGTSGNSGGNNSGSGGSSGSTVSGGSGSGSPGSTPGSSGGSAAGPEHLIYAQTGNGVMVYDAHPAQGKLELLAGPVGTNLSIGNGVHYDAAEHVVFATGVGPNPDRGSTTDYVAVVSVNDPKNPALLNTQQMSPGGIQNLLIDQTGLLPVEVSFGNTVQSWRYDPAAHTFQTLGSPQFFDAGDVPTTWLHPNQQIVVAVSASGPANGPFTTHVTTFRRDPGSGALTKNATLNLSDEAGGSALSPDGHYLLVPDTQSGVVAIMTIDAGTGSLTLAGKSSTSAIFYMYRFVDATHVLGRAKSDDANKLTLYTFDATNSSVAAQSTVQLAGTLPNFVSAGNTIYAAETGWLEMIAFDPGSNSLRVIASVNAGANALDVNPSP